LSLRRTEIVPGEKEKGKAVGKIRQLIPNLYRDLKSELEVEFKNQVAKAAR